MTTKEDRNFETFVTFADSMDAGCSYLDEPSFDILEWAGIRAPFCSNLQRGLPTGAVQPMAVTVTFGPYTGLFPLSGAPTA